jgi:HD-GYP domain-containing protein (c-di-GMP phosphodiesterase class II)
MWPNQSEQRMLRRYEPAERRLRSPPRGTDGRALDGNRSGYGPATGGSALLLCRRDPPGEALGFESATLRDAYYYALLRYIPGQIPDVLELAARYLRQANAGEPPERMATIVANALSELPGFMRESFAGHCEVGQRLAGRMGLDGSLIVCLGQIYERWDGHGLPRGLNAEELAPAVLLVALAQDAVIWNRIGGAEAAASTIRKRSGGAHHPRMAERFCEEAATILADLDRESTLDSILALEPGGHRPLTNEEFDRSCEAIADFADIKSPYTVGHSPGVAALAMAAGRRCGLVEADVTALRRAGLLHDIGRVGVSAGIWGKEAALSAREREQIRLHPYYTDRILARPEPLRRLGHLASRHHERMDGSGYHRAATGQSLSPAARVLAAADAYKAMTEPRPYRPALSSQQAAEELGREARVGRLDADAVSAVLAEAGHRVTRTRRQRPAGLSEREIEVLRLLTRGLSNRDMTESLFLSQDTIKHHIQHVYDKSGCPPALARRCSPWSTPSSEEEMARTGYARLTESAHAVPVVRAAGEARTQEEMPMTAEENAATYRRWFDEGCSRGYVDLADELYSPDYVSHSLGPDLPPTREGLKVFIRALREGIPDLDCPIEEVVAKGNRVAGRFSLRGTHAGSLLGTPATGRRVDVGVMVIARYDETGKWIEDWTCWDQLGLLQQIGVIPAPAAA